MSSLTDTARALSVAALVVAGCAAAPPHDWGAAASELDEGTAETYPALARVGLGRVRPVLRGSVRKNEVGRCWTTIGPGNQVGVQVFPKAERAGELRAGDVVVAVGVRPTTTVLDFLTAIAEAPAGRPLTLKVRRSGGREPYDLDELPGFPWIVESLDMFPETHVEVSPGS